jgi:hypothetical protein
MAYMTLLGVVALFWPIFILLAIGLAVFVSPALLGIYARKLKKKQDEERKRRYEALSGSEKILKK